jgi:glycosyltransferase involved in cell wall biosynthesis
VTPNPSHSRPSIKCHMISPNDPLVSIVTPVYNGAKYLSTCIESVLDQTYQHWDYTIVDNCSTDGTLSLARHYAQKESRVRIVSNSSFVPVIANHNIAFQLISSHSAYCKVVSADDWLYPEAIEKLVSLAETHPRVGIVGSYALYESGVRWPGLPYHTSVFNGKEVCRLYLRGEIDAFGTPSSVLYRSPLIRSHMPFYPGVLPNADMAACLVALEDADYGFVHQILSFDRVHHEAVGSILREVNSFLLDRLQFLDEYGSRYLDHQEMDDRREQLLNELYRSLAVAFVNCRRPLFWQYYRRRLDDLGYSLFGCRMLSSVLLKVLDLALNPKNTLEKGLARIK